MLEWIKNIICKLFGHIKYDLTFWGASKKTWYCPRCKQWGIDRLDTTIRK